MGQKLSSLRLAVCPGCKKSSTLLDWDKATKDLCTTREMRRSYRSVLDKKNWAHGVCRYYACPLCGNLYRANQLKLEPMESGAEHKEDEQNLGGEPIEIKVTSNED